MPEPFSAGGVKTRNPTASMPAARSMASPKRLRCAANQPLLGGRKARSRGGTSVITARALVSTRSRHDIHRLMVAPIHANTFATIRLVMAGASSPPQKTIKETALS